MAVLQLRAPDSSAAPVRGLPRPAGATAAWFALCVLLLSSAPLHVAMPLASDAVLYDLQAQTVLAGGVLYRDVFETNLPGIVWLHVAVRSLVGWSSEALRLVDLTIFGGLVWLVTRLLRRCEVSPAARATAAFALFACYLSVSEWCHCQRDTWMLLPALAALGVRLRQAERLAGRRSSSRAIFAWSLVEGLLWAAAFWIKPFVAIPALACFVVSAWRAGRLRSTAFDASGLICGGLAAGAAGILWLHGTGAWPFFLDTFLHWNPDYVAGGRSRWTLDRLYGMGYRLFPWILIHAAAVPLATFMLMRAIRGERAPASVPGNRDPHAPRRPPAILSAFYLGWLAQTLALQQPFDYIQIPPILLGVAVLAVSWRRLWPRPLVRLATAAFVVLAAVSSPALKSDRLSGWGDCLTEGSTPRLRDRLAYLRTPSYTELQPVADFLRTQHVGDGDVTCFHVHLIHLYPQLGIRPSTRYVGLEALRRLFPRQRATIDRTVAASGHRFVVADLVEAGLSVAAARRIDAGGPLALPPDFPVSRRAEFPFDLPVVFRSGRYVVLADVSSNPLD
ncbi:MAG TPA: hypothetical protein VML55_12200 [Planctomycetaceae bacterium]|nr:hypothetical protein [Planctomycetaceae bacterium]